MIPAHLDLQKIADVYINNDNYKVLKPTIHSVTDHFQEKMMRRETELPSGRVFLDGNGLRHFWNVFNEKSKSLRRLIPDKEVDVIEGQDNMNSRRRKSKTSKASKSKTKGRVANVKVTTKASKKTTLDDSEEEIKTTTPKPTTTKRTTTTRTTTKTSPTTKDGPKRKTPGRYSVRKKLLNKKKLENYLLRSSITKLVKKDEKKGSTRDGPERTLVKTTFFCPFFGVMTMHSYLDDDAPKAAEEKAADNKEEKEKGDDKDKDQDKDKDENKDKDKDKNKDKDKDQDKDKDKKKKNEKEDKKE